MSETTIKSPADQLRDAWQDGPYGSVVLYGADLLDEQVKTINSLRSELEEARGRIGELEGLDADPEKVERWMQKITADERYARQFVVAHVRNIKSLCDKINAKDARIAELEAAIKPFAEAANSLPADFPDHALIAHTATAPVTVADLRNALSKLEGKSTETVYEAQEAPESSETRKVAKT